jgi:membrane-associated protease RseP (regulator of RpoE activity)
MSEQDYFEYYGIRKERKKSAFRKWGVFFLLLGITFITTLLAGMQWVTGSVGPYEFTDLTRGLPYALSILFVLSVHEFGHYFAARLHGVDSTLPFYIPFPPIPYFLNFGTMGAVIKTKSRIMDNRTMFDIGVAGPIAGFFASVIVLIYGFTHMPGVDYILKIHPDFFTPDYGKNAVNLTFGNTLLFEFFRQIFSEPGKFMPPMSEIYHYPYLCVGWFGLFVTAMNMIPVGQLDGGHVIYSMFGAKVHKHFAGISMLLLGFLGFLGIFESLLEVNWGIGWSGWIFWGLILYFLIKIEHPPVLYFEPLNKTRMALGYFSIFILLVSFSPAPFVLSP